MKAACLWAGIAIVAALLLLSCGGHHREASLVSLSGSNSRPSAAPVSLNEALAELDALPTPEGVDEAVFSELRSALAHQLRTQSAERGTSKLVAAPPIGESNRVTDLSVTGVTATTVSLAWHYVNVGDYNQDGLVGVSDLTPLAVHFNEPVDESNEWIDGSGDGVINIMDITPLAAHFFVSCEAYEVQGKVAVGDDFERVGEVELKDAQANGRLAFSASFDLGGFSFFRVVPIDAYGGLGEPSNVVPVDLSPPEILGVSPTEGAAGSEVQFTASVSGTPPISYTWNFGTAAEPSTSHARNPTVTLGDVGEYQVSLTATNAFGEDSFNFTLTVTVMPPQIEGVSPTEGQSGSDVKFTVTLTGTPPFTFRWDFDGGASPDTPETTAPEVTVTLLAEGQYHDASVTAENEAGEDTFGFELTVTPPPQPPQIADVQPRSGIEGNEVVFTATVSGDEPITYLWDFDGGANPNTPETSGPQVKVELLAADSYEASLTAENAAGSATFPFTLEVSPAGSGFKVVAAPVGASHPSMLVAQGSPVIVFTKDEDSLPYSVRAKDAVGAEWGECHNQTGAIGIYSNNLMCIVAGKPAVASSVGYMIEGGRIAFCRAQDEAGSIWGVAHKVWDGFTIAPTAPGVCEVDGYPAVAFSNDDLEDCKLLYMRATCVEGCTWPLTPTVVTSLSGSSNAQSSMIIADGKPAILHTWWGGTIFVRALDTLGESWGEPMDITQQKMGVRSSMALIGGNPAVAIEIGGELPHELVFRRALNADGSQWDDVVTVVSLEAGGVVGTGGRICLAEINGRPAIAYSHTPGTICYFVKYVVAKNAEGTEWNEPITVDPATDVSDGITLAQVAGRPAMAYGNRVAEELIYIRADDEYGLIWPEE
ncbi:MAG: hypothetical protein B1H03_02105 [Planctomycetales bacterium 4484_113]|nr:MAG: hypothetical protein B1H03_02105 [Planctomycetales bacterium 4484_113]